VSFYLCPDSVAREYDNPRKVQRIDACEVALCVCVVWQTVYAKSTAQWTRSFTYSCYFYRDVTNKRVKCFPQNLRLPTLYWFLFGLGISAFTLLNILCQRSRSYHKYRLLCHKTFVLFCHIVPYFRYE